MLPLVYRRGGELMPWIDLDEVKAHLNKTSTNDDGELEGFIPAACAAIEDIVGHVDPVSFSVVRQAASRQASRTGHQWYSSFTGAVNWPGTGWRRWWIELQESPVLAVSSVTLLTADVPAYNAVTGAAGWHLDETMLFLPGPGLYQVTYTAGRNPVPENYRLATLELIAHLWRGSQLNQSSGRGPVGGDQMMAVPRTASAMPYRVRELLGLYGDVVNDHVVIA